uniref:(California timema) hypothetical protein n=1 Tax=Timema californicum TaxID=61474 RepID=A0A7R9IZJ1_TIMCA|nr:unnamed protein product [Timema californicum]
MQSGSQRSGSKTTMLYSSLIFIVAVTSTLAGPIQTPGAPVVFPEDPLSNPGCAKPSGSPVVYPKEPVPDKDVQIPGSSVVYPKEPVPDKDFQIPGSPVVYPKDQRGVESDFCTSCYDTNSVFCCNFFRRCCDEHTKSGGARFKPSNHVWARVSVREINVPIKKTNRFTERLSCIGFGQTDKRASVRARKRLGGHTGERASERCRLNVETVRPSANSHFLVLSEVSGQYPVRRRVIGHVLSPCTCDVEPTVDSTVLADIWLAVETPRSVISPCPTGAKPDSSSPERPLCPDLQVCRPPGKC